MPRVRAEDLVPEGHRAVVVAPHPDDEVLGLGGLLVQLARLHRKILLIAATDGTASHPHCPALPAKRLGRIRAAETRDALARLGVEDLTLVRLGLADGGLAAASRTLERSILCCLRPMDVVFATWRFDGHPDHEAAGTAARKAAALALARFVEVPIWAWHWGVPGDPSIPWSRARRLELGAETLERKRYAVAAYSSQVSPGFQRDVAPVLPPSALARLLRSFEVAFV